MTVNFNSDGKFIKTNQINLNQSTNSNKTNNTLANTFSNNTVNNASELWNSFDVNVETDATPKDENVIDGGSIPGIYVDRSKATGHTHVFCRDDKNYVEVVHSDSKVTKGHFEYSDEDHAQGKGVDDEVSMVSSADYDELKTEIGASHATTSVSPNKLFTSTFMFNGDKYIEVKEPYSKITTGHWEYNADHTEAKGVDDNVKFELSDGTEVKH